MVTPPGLDRGVNPLRGRIFMTEAYVTTFISNIFLFDKVFLTQTEGRKRKDAKTDRR